MNAASILEAHDMSCVKRSAKVYSFGTKEQCKSKLMAVLSFLDQTTDSIVWLPEYDKVVDWLSDTKGMGLFLHGDCGRGKTNILNAISFFFLKRFGKVLKPVHVDDLYKVMKDNDYHGKWAFCIDEVGAETEANDYGVRKYPFKSVINNAETHKKLLVISSNLNSAQLMEKYDERTVDRIAGLCRAIRFEGKSMRRNRH